MAKLARHGDVGQGTCTAHPVPIPMTGTIIASASVLTCDGLQAALDGDIVKGTCGHTGKLIATTAVLTVGGKKAVRVGDSFSGAFSGTIKTGSGVSDSK